MNQDKAASAAPGDESGIYELFIVALTLFSWLLVVAYYLLPLTAAAKGALLWLDVPISLIFLADSFGCLRRAQDKRAYLKWGWLDFLGSVPLIPLLRVARVRRLIGVRRTLRLRRLRQVGEDLDQNRAEGAALIMLLLAIVVLTASTVAVLEFESEAPQANIRSREDAFWWSLVTMATVGYGDYYPVTAWGRVAAVALMTVGIGIFGVLASYLANLFLPRTRNDDGSADLAEIKAELAAMNSRLASIEARLSDRPPPGPGEVDVET